MTATRRKFAPITRKIPERFKKQVEKISRPIGELVWASNYAHGAFCLLFCEVVDPKDPRKGESIWNALKSDSAQRDVLHCVAWDSANYAIASRVKWAMQKAGKLSSIRNDAVHTAIMFDHTQNMKPVILGPMVSEVRRRRMASYKNIGNVFKTAAKDFMQLSSYVISLVFVMQDKTGSAPWPNRPKLRSKLK